MAQVVDAAGKVRAPKTNTKTTSTKGGGGPAALRAAMGQDNALPIRPQIPGNEPLTEQLGRGAKPVTQTSSRPNIVPDTTWSPAQPVMASPAPGLSGFSGITRNRAATNDVASLLPNYGTNSQTNSAYETYFRDNGMSDDDINEINGRGSWLDVHMNNPATKKVTDNIGQNPFLGVSIDDLRGSAYDGNGNITPSGSDDYPFLSMNIDDDMDINELRMSAYDKNGRLSEPSDQTSYDNADTIGRGVVDDGLTMDYDHLTADRATGQAMQRYSEAGFGGRDWWEYSPNSIYQKSDEEQDHDFTPYLPDQTSVANMVASQLMDAPSDITGALGSARELLTDYKINYDPDNNPSTDDSVSLSGSDWDYRSNPYMDNMSWLMEYEPETLLRSPEGGTIHGAPVTVSVNEYEIPNVDGGISYAYGDIINNAWDLNLVYDDGHTLTIPGEEIDKVLDEDGYIRQEYADGYDSSYSTLRLDFSDGQSIEVPEDQYAAWYNPKTDGYSLPEGTRIRTEDARGFLPDDLDSLNDEFIKKVKDGKDSVLNAPVQYLPDLVMDDGTRLTFDQVKDIYYDKDAETDPYAEDKVTYDFSALTPDGSMFQDNLATPRRFVGEIVDPDAKNPVEMAKGINWGGMINNGIDFTLGSLPISIDTIAWPTSVLQGLSKSMYGIDPGRYDPITGSDKYISADFDDKGNLKPTFSDVQQAANTAGNMLVPLTEQLAGPISGHSAIEALSGELPSNPTVRQILANYALGAFGEGIEEDVGNVFDELTGQGEAAYGMPTTRSGKPLLDENGEPIRNEDGSYRYVNVWGEPMTEMTDASGHVYKSRDDKLGDRLGRAVDPNDAVNAFAGGALVDTFMQGIPILRSLGPAIQRGQVRKASGVEAYRDAPIDSDEDYEWQEVDDRYLMPFSNKSMRARESEE